MTKQKNVLDESQTFIREIENNLEKTLVKRREEIERDLQARISKEKAESERRLNEIEEEIARERETLNDYRGAITTFETERDALQMDIKSHLDKSIAYQKDIEHLTSLTLEELCRLSELTATLNSLRERTELQVTEIRNKLREKYGVVTEPLDMRDPGDVVVNLQQELSKLKQIQAILEEETTPAEPMMPAAGESAVPAPSPEAPPAAAFIPIEAPAPASGEIDPSRPEFKMPEINMFIEEFVKKEEDEGGDAPIPDLMVSQWQDKEEPVSAEAPAPAPAPAANAPIEEVNFQAVFETLEKSRKSEPTDYNGEISFFKNGDTTILDGETIIRAVSHLVDDGRKIYQKLAATESPKDQFFLKQDLINHQEILRKIILRGVKLCEKENSRLPRYTEDVLNIRNLKDILDKLNLDNWSNEEEFNAFETMTSRIKDAFYKRITPPALYLKSIVQELGV